MAAAKALPRDSLKLEQWLLQRVSVRPNAAGSHALARNDAEYALPVDGGRIGRT
jgi:hypothetical protein